MLFIYGSLRPDFNGEKNYLVGCYHKTYKDLFNAAIPAVLEGYEMRRTNREHGYNFPGIFPNKEKTVYGLVMPYNDDLLQSLDYFEGKGDFYDRLEVDVKTENGIVRAFVYIPLPGEDKTFPITIESGDFTKSLQEV